MNEAIQIKDREYSDLASLDVSRIGGEMKLNPCTAIVDVDGTVCGWQPPEWWIKEFEGTWPVAIVECGGCGRLLRHTLWNLNNPIVEPTTEQPSPVVELEVKPNCAICEREGFPPHGCDVAAAQGERPCLTVEPVSAESEEAPEGCTGPFSNAFDCPVHNPSHEETP